MIIHKAFRFRLYPDKFQQSEIAKEFGCARFVYNYYLDKRKSIYFDTGKTFTYIDCAKDLTQLKHSTEFEWLKKANAQVLQQSLQDLDNAYKHFFEMLKTGTLPAVGKKPRNDGMPKGYPTFWSKCDDQSIRYPQGFKVQQNQIYLPKLGWVHLHKHQTIWGKANSITVSKTKSGKYFVSIQCVMEISEPKPVSGGIGIDLGLKDFATLSTGEKVEAQNNYRKSERTLKIRQRRVSRKVKGSRSRTKARIALACTHEKVANRRQDFHHKLSHRIVRDNGLIAFEDLNVKGMMGNHSLAKSIGDAGWSQFVTFTTYKAKWAGAQIEHVDRFFPSSKLCSDCGHKNNNLKLSDRDWVCKNCGSIHDRDINSAINILNQTTLGAKESDAGGDTSQGSKHCSAPEKFQRWTQLMLWPLEAQPIG